MNHRIRTITICVFGFLAGCSTVERQRLTAGDDLWGGYKPNAIYKTQEDVFLLKLSESYGSAPIEHSLTPGALFGPRSNVYGAPDSVMKYLDSGDASVRPSSGRRYLGTTKVAGVVKAGTRIRVYEAVKYRKWSWFFGAITRVVGYADILDGPFSGVRTDIQDLSEYHYLNYPSDGDVLVPFPDVGVLYKISPGE